MRIVDIVVIGGGGAGLAAAAAATQRAATTVLLEKASTLGGTTRLAVGSISAGCTRLQRAAGIVDRIDDFRVDMDAFTGDLLPRDNPTLRAVLAAEAGVTVDWLERLGVAFAGPYPEPPHRVKRMHNAIPGARMIVARLEHAARSAGLTVQLQSELHALITDDSGAVVGVDCSYDGVRHRLFARRGVVLATGDFSGNAQMRERFLPRAAARAMPINPGNIGDGHRAAMAVGAVPCNMDMIFGPQMRFPRASRAGLSERLPPWPWLSRLSARIFMHAPAWALRPLVKSLLIANMSPSEQLFREGAVLVDVAGCRLDTQRPAIAIAEAEQTRAYIVLSEGMAQRFCSYPHYISTAPGIAFAYLPDYLRGRPDIARRVGSAAALAREMGMDAAQLNRSLETLPTGPLVVLGPVQAMLTTTEGSVAVDAQCRVLKTDGEVIEGLYAAGCIGQGGLLLRGHGMHLAWTLTSGRIAAETAARCAPRQVVDDLAAQSAANHGTPALV